MKSNSVTEKKMSANVKKYTELTGGAAVGKVCYLGDLSCEINGVRFVSWKDWGR